LLLWLSLLPFATAWMGEHDFARTPTAVYGVMALLSACAYIIFQTTIIRDQGPMSPLAAAVGRDVKGKISLVIYLVSIPLAFVSQWLSLAGYAVVACI